MLEQLLTQWLGLDKFDCEPFKFTDSIFVQQMTEEYAIRHRMTLQQVLDIQKRRGEI
jgi:hypothetical protein